MIFGIGGDSMITYEDKKFDTWDDVVRQYPAMWVVFDKANLAPSCRTVRLGGNPCLTSPTFCHIIRA